MHILLINDDGPPSNQHSPYVHSFAKALQNAGHLVSVCLPHIQRSWIGKAHMIGQVLTPSYFRPGTLYHDDGTISSEPFSDGEEEWVLIDGTPASCAQIGLYHLFKDRPPIDLVVSGPNFGRNTTVLFALSSGTIGGALEAAVCGKKSVALSYAFDKKVADHLDPDNMAAASAMSTELIEKLVAEWPSDVHLYCINVPLEKGGKPNKIVYTAMLQNEWTGSSFKEVVEEAEDADPGAEEEKIREGRSVNGQAPGDVANHQRVRYKWAPKYMDIWETSMKAGTGDGHAILHGCVSVTPLKANFWSLPQYRGEIKLEPVQHNRNITTGTSGISEGPNLHNIFAIVDWPDEYVGPLISRTLDQIYGSRLVYVTAPCDLPYNSAPLVQLGSYERIDFEFAMQQPAFALVCAYVIRKALIRKHYLSNTVSTWLVKHPDSVLASTFKTSVHFELDYAQFLDEALVDAWDLNESLQRNAGKTRGEAKEWWILKPGMSDGGNGIRLFSSLEELQAIFEEWDPQENEDGFSNGDDDNDAADDNNDNTSKRQQTASSPGEESGSGYNAMTSQLRHFIAQPYVDQPLLLASTGHRKFHVRTYVLAVGSLKVYVYKEMLALFAAKPYAHPTNDNPVGVDKLDVHLTNTCFQTDAHRSSAVHRFWALEDHDALPSDWQNQIFEKICHVAGEVFEAAAREQMIHFQTLPNAFEIFGVDFLVDQDLQVWLLELNAYPDFKQTGPDLQDVVIGGLYEEVVRVAVQPFFEPALTRDGSEQLRLVRNLDLGRR